MRPAEPYVLRLQPHEFASPHRGVGERDVHDEVGVSAGQDRRPLGEEQRLERRGPYLLHAAARRPHTERRRRRFCRRAGFVSISPSTTASPRMVVSLVLAALGTPPRA